MARTNTQDCPSPRRKALASRGLPDAKPPSPSACDLNEGRIREKGDHRPVVFGMAAATGNQCIPVSSSHHYWLSRDPSLQESLQQVHAPESKADRSRT